MKKFVLMLAAALILAASCEKAEQPKADPTTYTFVDNAGNYEFAVEHLRGLGYTLDGDMTDDGFTVKVNYVLKEYADGLAVKQNVVKNPARGGGVHFHRIARRRVCDGVYRHRHQDGKAEIRGAKVHRNGIYVDGREGHPDSAGWLNIPFGFRADEMKQEGGVVTYLSFSKNPPKVTRDDF